MTQNKDGKIWATTYTGFSMSDPITAVRLPEAQKDLLRQLAQKSGCTESAILRDAIQIGLQQLLLQTMSTKQQAEYTARQAENVKQKAAEIGALEEKLLLTRREFEAAKLSIKYVESN